MFSQSLPRRKSLLSVRARTKTHATVSQDCLLGGCAFGASGYLKILYAIFAIIYIISLPGDCHAYARNDKGWGHTHTRTDTYSRRTYTRYVLIQSASRKAARTRTPSLTVVPSDCAVLLRSWRTKDGGIISELSLSMRVPTVSPANDG